MSHRPRRPRSTPDQRLYIPPRRLDAMIEEAHHVVAVCYRGRDRQAIPILELPLPHPPPTGWEWIEAYRRWARGQ